jgi:hypothetical protein
MPHLQSVHSPPKGGDHDHAKEKKMNHKSKRKHRRQERAR